MNPMHSGNLRPSCADTPTSRVRRTHTRSTSIGKSMLMAKNASKSANALTDTARGDANRACRSVMTAMSDALLVLHSSWRKLGPVVRPVVGTKFPTSHLTIGQAFDSHASIRGRQRLAARPLADQALRDTKRVGEFALPVLDLGEVGSKIHARILEQLLLLVKRCSSNLLV